MRTFIYVFCLSSFAAFSTAQEKPKLEDQRNREYVAYQAAGRIGAEMFLAVYKKDGFGLRTAAMLRACGQDGLAKAVDAKLSDPRFEKELDRMIKEHRFADLPPYTIGSAQSVANAMRTGYEAGYREANGLTLTMPDGKDFLCAVATRNANEILK